MPTENTKQDVVAALEQIRLAEQELDDLIAATSETSNLLALSSVYDQLTAMAAALIRVQMIADDEVFEQATTHLKVQANALQASEDSIKKIVKDMAIAGKVLGYIAEAVTIVAKLP